MSATEFNRANLSPLPLCGVYSPTGMPVRRNSWYSAVPDDFFSTMNESGSHSRYSSVASSLSSGNSTRFLMLLSRMMLYVLAPGPSRSSLKNTPHVVSAVKSARLWVSAAASSVMITYSHLGGSSFSQMFHHSRLTTEASSDVGFCWYCAFHWNTGIDALVRSSAVMSKNSGHSGFSVTLLGSALLGTLRIAGNSTTSYWSALSF